MAMSWLSMKKLNKRMIVTSSVEGEKEITAGGHGTLWLIDGSSFLILPGSLSAAQIVLGLSPGDHVILRDSYQWSGSLLG